MEQQRTFLYLAVGLLGFLIYTTWQQDKIKATQASTKQEQVQEYNQAAPSSAADVVSTTPAVPVQSSRTPAVNNVIEPVPTAITNNNNQNNVVRVKTDVLDVYIDLQGGSLLRADLLTYPVSLEEKDKPVRILNSELGYIAQSGLLHQNGLSKRAPNHYGLYKTQQSEYVLDDGQESLTVPLTWTSEDGVTVTKTYTFTRSKFNIAQTHTVNNQSSAVWVGSEYLQLIHPEARSQGSLLTGGVQAYNGGAYYNEKYEKVSFDDMQDEKLNQNVVGGWAAIIQHYFVSAWVPPQEAENNFYTNYIAQGNKHIIGVRSPLKNIAPGGEASFKNELYVGPAIQKDLEKLAKGLELTTDYGIFTFISKPLFSVMSFIHKYVGNWGWTIIFTTLLIKILFFYPSAISYRSMAKMKKLNPKIQQLNSKYKNDPQTKQKEMMKFYRKEKINPLGGCLPMLIQIPVFMGLYWVLLESVELRQAPWLAWYKDLSIKDPTFILPLLMGGSMWLQHKLNPPMMNDPLQKKIFMYLPLVFTVMFLFFPAGLVLYWVVNNILSMAQQWYITNKIVGKTATS